MANKNDFLIFLFGNINYDGRVQRLLEVVEPLGAYDLLDSENVKSSKEYGGWRREIKAFVKKGKITRHLYFWSAAIMEALRKHPKVVIGCDYFTALPALVASRLAGAMLIYDAHELIIPENGKRMCGRNFFWYILEKLIVKRADLVIAANQDRSRMMKDHYGLPVLPTVMRNIPPSREDDVHATEVNDLYPDLLRRDASEKLILYQGGVSLARGIERILYALDFLPESYRFIIAGDGMDLPRLKKIGKRFECKGRFTALGKIENRLMTSIARFADVGIITYPFEGLNNIFCAPNKLFEYAHAGLPVVATNQPPLRRAIEAFRIGEVVTKTDSPRQIAQLLMKVAENKKDYQQQIKLFLAANRWEDEASRVREAVVKVFKQE